MNAIVETKALIELRSERGRLIAAAQRYGNGWVVLRNGMPRYPVANRSQARICLREMMACG